VVAKTAVGAVNVRRNWTQTPDQQPADIKLWTNIRSAFQKVKIHSPDMTPDQAWERRSASKAKLQQAPLPGPSTGKLARSIAHLFQNSYTNFFCSPLLVLLGRTVYITQEQSFVKALNRLDQIIRTNHVRRDLMQSRFFTKGYVQRHKLNAIRWRRRFAQMVGSRNRAPEYVCLSPLLILLSRYGKR
jgi:hypothetical protein